MSDDRSQLLHQNVYIHKLPEDQLTGQSLVGTFLMLPRSKSSRSAAAEMSYHPNNFLHNRTWRPYATSRWVSSGPILAESER